MTDKTDFVPNVDLIDLRCDQIVQELLIYCRGSYFYVFSLLMHNKYVF